MVLQASTRGWARACMYDEERIQGVIGPTPLWSACRKSFIETRSLGAVLVAFSRVYVLHAILLCWMTLLVRFTVHMPAEPASKRYCYMNACTQTHA